MSVTSPCVRATLCILWGQLTFLAFLLGMFVALRHLLDEPLTVPWALWGLWSGSSLALVSIPAWFLLPARRFLGPWLALAFVGVSTAFLLGFAGLPQAAPFLLAPNYLILAYAARRPYPAADEPRRRSRA